jgi:hypothetical protein
LDTEIRPSHTQELEEEEESLLSLITPCELPDEYMGQTMHLIQLPLNCTKGAGVKMEFNAWVYTHY